MKAEVRERGSETTRGSAPRRSRRDGARYATGAVPPVRPALERDQSQ